MIIGREISDGLREDLTVLDGWYTDLHDALVNMLPVGPQRDRAIHRLTESQMWAELSKLDGSLFSS